MISLLLTVGLAGSLAWGARLDGGYLPPRGGSGAGLGVVSPPFGGGGGAGSHFGGGGAAGGGGSYTPSGPVIPIVSYQNNPNLGDGSYSYSYQTGNGISAQESGKQTGPESQSVTGGYSYTGPDGRTYSISYVADELGFRAVGDHLPTPPPIPPEILKALQTLPKNPSDTGAYNPSVHGGGSYQQGHGGGGFKPSGSFNPGSGYHYRK